VCWQESILTTSPAGMVTMIGWPTERQFTRRGEPGFLQHTLPPHFARVRTFGWLHPAAKVRANRVRALLHQAPLLTPAEQQT